MTTKEDFVIAFANFKEHYTHLLEKFLNDELLLEDYLNEGYQFGRNIVKNFSVLSIAAIHHDALIDYLQKPNIKNHLTIVAKANLLLEEVLVAAAMVPTEYFREAIKLLNKRSIEFAVRIRGLQEEIITRKKISEETNRLKSEFLANMSHELRTPLNAIIGFTELMHQEKIGPIPAQYKEFIIDILNSSQHLLSLINEILDLTKVEAGKMEFFPEVIKLTQLIEEVYDTMRALLHEKNITLEIIPDPELTHIVIDPNKLRQILYNYISNAIKFSEKGSNIRITTKAIGNGFFRLEVIDQGIGISKDKLNQLFVAFQQLDISVAKKYQGTGLGLALTKRIVEAQGGEVGVESELGKGSTFYAVLPCAPIYNDVETSTEKN